MPPATGHQTEYTGGAHGNETGVGAMLRTARMRLGEDLRSVAQMLCIRYPYLEAIEEGRFNELPGQTYAIGFIRAYSDRLGLDSDEVIRRYKVETAADARGQELSFPTPVPETGIPGGAIVFVGIVVAVIAYGAWYVSTSENNILADLVSPVPERLAEQTEGAEQGTPPLEPAEPAAPVVVPKPEEPATSAEPATADTPTSDPEPATAEDEQTAEPDQVIPEPSQEAATEPEAAEPETTAAETDTPAATEQPSEQAATEATAAGEASQDARETTETAPAASEPDDAATSETETQPAPEPVAEVEEPVAAIAEDASRQDPVTESAPAQTVQSAITEETEPAAVTEISQTETADQPAPAEEPVSTGEETASAVQTESEAAPETTALPEQPAEVSALPEDAASTEEEGDDTPPPEEPAEEVAEEPATQPLQEEVATATEPAPLAEAPSAETTIASTGGPRIVLRAITSSWIQVRDDAANQMLVTRLLRAGESYEVPDRPGLKLLTGNAGALEVVVDGQVAPSIGDVGVVRRGVVLDAERLLSGTAVDN